MGHQLMGHQLELLAQVPLPAAVMLAGLLAGCGWARFCFYVFLTGAAFGAW